MSEQRECAETVRKAGHTLLQLIDDLLDLSKIEARKLMLKVVDFDLRGGVTEVLEGDWKPKRIVVLEFESMQRAKDWLNCEEYSEPRKMRHRTAKTNMLLVDGA